MLVLIKPQPKNMVVNVDGVIYDADCIKPGRVMKPPHVSWQPLEVDGKWFWKLSVNGIKSEENPHE